MAVRRSSNRPQPHIDKTTILHRVEAVSSAMRSRGEIRRADIYENALIERVDNDNDAYIKALDNKLRYPVCIEEFMDSEDFLGGLPEFSIWPEIRADLIELHPDHMRGNCTAKTEAILGGATGWGKSVILQISTLYAAHFLTCFRTPQNLYKGLNKFTPIVFMLQSVQENVTKRVLYEPIRAMFEEMKYFKRYVEHDKYKREVLRIKGGIEIVPALTNITSILGQAVLLGAMDEVNFMDVVEQSKQVAGPRGQGGKYDQAEQVYTTLTRRRTGRFITRGPDPGGIYISSSAHYEGDFLARRIEKAREEEFDHVFIRERAQYEARPAEVFAGDTFRFLLGTDRYPPRILDEDEVVDQITNPDIRDIPSEYEKDFRTDPYGAQRDILGIASSAISRFIPQVNKIVDAMAAGEEAGLKPWVEKLNVDLEEDGMPVIVEENLPSQRARASHQWFAHIDLSISGDRCGIAVSRVIDHVEIEGDDGQREFLPIVETPLAISIQPSKTHELDIGAVRRWVMALKLVWGFNLYMVTYDGFQSKESIQVLTRKQIRSEVISVDKDTEAYDLYKRALLDDRVILSTNPVLRVELMNLERLVKDGKVKIDHPPKGSKDVADAVASSALAATRSRANRAKTQALGRNESGEDVKKKMRRRKTRKPRVRTRKRVQTPKPQVQEPKEPIKSVTFRHTVG